MAAPNDGGPAYPVLPPLGLDNTSAVGYPYVSQGLSQRDWFAAHASEEDILYHRRSVPKVATVVEDDFTGRKNCFNLEPADWREQARYLHADAMLKAREGKA